MDRPDHFAFLSSLTNQPFEKVYRKGFGFFKHALMPHLLEAGKDKQFNRGLLSDSWQLVGDIYRTNGAPLKAMKAYQKAEAAQKGRAELMKRMAGVHTDIGRYHEAFQTINQALDIELDNFQLMTERQRIQDDMNYDAAPRYTEGDTVWVLKELLAEEQFEKVINIVLETEMNDVELLKCLARAFGAVSHHANYLQVWQIVIGLDEGVLTEPADWFYLPVEFREEPLLKAVFKR